MLKITSCSSSLTEWRAMLEEWERWIFVNFQYDFTSWKLRAFKWRYLCSFECGTFNFGYPHSVQKSGKHRSKDYLSVICNCSGALQTPMKIDHLKVPVLGILWIRIYRFLLLPPVSGMQFALPMCSQLINGTYAVCRQMNLWLLMLLP